VVPLSLIVGPANAGKVARLLELYAAALEDDPFLVVPNRAEVERIERELLAANGALLGGTIGTFADLFDRLASRLPGRPVLSRTQRRALLGRVVAGGAPDGLEASARFPGFVDALADAIADVEAALLDPDEVGGELGRLQRAYRAELEQLGVWDREALERAAVETLGRSFTAWNGSPVLAYGFEDLTGAQWSLLEGLAARADVTVSLPYEPGRTAFSALRRTAEDLGRVAAGRIEELPARSWGQAESLRALERALFEPARTSAEPLEGGIAFLEAAGGRAALELVAEDLLGLLAEGVPGEQIGVFCPDVGRIRRPLEVAFDAFSIPYVLESRQRVARVPLGRSLLAVARVAWLDGARPDLFLHLRSPYSGLPRGRVDFVEGRLRGRAILEPARALDETVALLGRPLDAVDRLRAPGSPIDAIRAVVDGMLVAAWGTERPVADDAVELDLAARDAITRALGELDAWQALGQQVTRRDVVAAIEEARLRAPGPRPGFVSVLDLERARTRRFEAVYVLGLEEGVLPRRGGETPFLSDERRRELELEAPRRRLLRADPVARDRYLFYTACTRARSRLVLVREAATDDGRPLEPSPFWDEVRRVFVAGDVERATRRRPLSALAWSIDRAPTERERLRAIAALAAADETESLALARANGVGRRLERAVAAFARPTRLSNRTVLAWLRDTHTFSVTDLDRFCDCSSMWLVERVVDPKEIDGRVDARLRGSAAHTALHRFYAGLPRRFGTDTVPADRVEEAVAFLRELLAEAVRGHARLDVPELELIELELGLARDLEQFVRQEAAHGGRLVPRRFEVSFGTDRAPAELQRGLDLGGFAVSGKIDRVDVDPYSAHGVVHDYKSGAAHSAAKIEADGILQIPLYVLALRDLLGLEPVGGLYRSLSGERAARGLLLAEAEEELVPGYPRADYRDADAFWAVVDGARDRARAAVARIREGDVRHDPRGGDCPSWCTWWSVCRVERS
jgi:ATP-dependent helicase/DNAse subunit B